VNPNKLFYYPYASFKCEHVLLLKAAALYFDTLYILNPLKANWAGIGQSTLSHDLNLLEQGMGDVAGELSPGLDKYAEGYVEVYNEYRETDRGIMEYRSADYPLPLVEAIMINHALFGGLLHTGATSLTYDSFHNKALALKIQRAQKIPGIRDILEDRARLRRLKSNQLAMSTLMDIDLVVISPELPMEKILQFRHENEDDLKKAREELVRLALKIRQNPWSVEFTEKPDVDVILNIQGIMEENKKARDSWFKKGRGKKAFEFSGPTASAASATISLALSAVTLILVAVATGILGWLGGSIIPGADLALDWKNGRMRQTGMD
jgi:hypothetical protein